MAEITTLVDFKDYIYERLGAPINNVEIDDAQMNNIISDAMLHLEKYGVGTDGSFLEYMIFNVSANVNDYPMSGQGIVGLVDFEMSTGPDGINTLFSPTNALLYSDFVQRGNILGTQSPDFSPGMILSNYDTAMMFLKEVKRHFNKMYTIEWIGSSQTLRVNPTPTENSTGVVYLYRKDAITEHYYNNLNFRNLCVAMAKYQWGSNLGKMNTTQPDGATVNYDRIISEAREEIANVIETIKKESYPIDLMIG